MPTMATLSRIASLFMRRLSWWTCAGRRQRGRGSGVPVHTLRGRAPPAPRRAREIAGTPDPRPRHRRPWRCSVRVASSSDRGRFPEVVGGAAGFVDLPEGELYGHAELHLLRVDVGHLEVEAGAFDVDDAGDE